MKPLPASLCAAVAAIATCALGTGCRSHEPGSIRLTARPASPTIAADPGPHPLRLGRWTTRDGTLNIPPPAADRKSRPLLVLLHGGGGDADDFRYTFPIGDETGVVILTLDSRDNTWDGVDSPFGPDVAFIDLALQYTFARVAIDPARIALGGASDGGFYALSVGMVNGDLFTHLIAVAPGRYVTLAPPVGRPRIFVAHGTRDNVYPAFLSRDIVVPKLKGAGYDVTYREFDGPHNIPPAIAREAMEWLTR
jgi:predicted esterase